MRIARITLDVISVARTTGFDSQHGLLRLHAADGTVGCGEMSDLSHLPKYSIDAVDLTRTLESVLVDRDCTDIVGINRDLLDLFPQTQFYYDKSAPIRCGVDIALHDLTARQLGVSVATLLGGAQRDRIKVCYPIFRNRGTKDVATNLAILAAKREEGFDTFRVYVGAMPDADEEFLAAVRAEHGTSVTIKSLDFSHLLDWKSALRVTRRLLQYDPMLIESPAPQNDFVGLREFRRAVDLPVSEHVWSFHEMHGLLQHDSVDVFNVCLTFIGGFEAARAVSNAAAVAGKSCLIGTTQELGLGTTAQALFASTLSNLWEISDPTGPCLYVDDIVDEKPRYENGFLFVPSTERHGLGVSVAQPRVERLRIPKFSWDRQRVSELQDRTARR